MHDYVEKNANGPSDVVISWVERRGKNNNFKVTWSHQFPELFLSDCFCRFEKNKIENFHRKFREKSFTQKILISAVIKVSSAPEVDNHDKSVDTCHAKKTKGENDPSGNELGNEYEIDMLPVCELSPYEDSQILVIIARLGKKFVCGRIAGGTWDDGERFENNTRKEK